MKYHPVYHVGVIDNLKREFKERYSQELLLPDAVIWKVYEEWYCVESDDSDDKELPIYQGLKEELESFKPKDPIDVNAGEYLEIRLPSGSVLNIEVTRDTASVTLGDNVLFSQETERMNAWVQTWPR